MLAEGGAQLLTDERFLAAYRALVEAVQSAGAAVTVLALPPVSSATFPGTEASVLTRNAALRTLAREAGASFVDFHAALVSEGEGAFFRDGFHPNERGSRILAEELIEHVETGTRAPRQVA